MLRSTLSRSSTQVIRASTRMLYGAAVPALAAVIREAPRTLLAGSSRIQRRSYATPPPQGLASAVFTGSPREDFSVEQYHDFSDVTMEAILKSLEKLLDETALPDYEVDYSSGVLTLKLGEHGTYVINKQPPNKQIWLSSPTSGPKRYDYVRETDQWVYSREKQALGELLNTELSKIFGRNIDLKINTVYDCL